MRTENEKKQPEEVGCRNYKWLKYEKSIYWLYGQKISWEKRMPL